MKVLELDSEMRTKTGFELRFSMLVPTAPGCYMLANIYEDVLYIGQTNNLQRRLEEHLADSRMRQTTQLGVATWFFYRKISELLTYTTEQSLLTEYKYHEGTLPLLNRAGP